MTLDLPTTLIVLAVLALGVAVGVWAGRARRAEASPGPEVGARELVVAVPPPAPLEVDEVPLFEVMPVPAREEVSRTQAPRAVVEQVRSWSDALVQAGAGGLAGSARTVRVVFAPHIEQGLATGAFRLMRAKDGSAMAVAVSADKGQVVGLGKLVKGPAAAAAVGLAWHVAAIVVAQHHMEAIERRLGRIDDRLRAIEGWLEDAQWSRIDGAREAVRMWRAQCAAGRPPEADRAQARVRLDQVDADLVEVLRFLERQLARLADEAAARVRRSWWWSGVVEETARVEALVARRQQLLSAWIDAAALRVTAASLRPTADLSVHSVRVRVEAVRDDAARLGTGIVEPLRAAFDARSAELSATFARSAPLDDHRALAADRWDDLALHDRWGATVDVLARLDAHARAPLTLDVHTDASGAISGVEVVTPASPGSAAALR